MELLFEYLGKGFMTMLSISMPCVLTAAAIGLVIGILQAVTQVQEQTIVAAPKIFSVFLVIMIFGIGFAKLLVNLLQEGTALAFNVIPKSDNIVIINMINKLPKKTKERNLLSGLHVMNKFIAPAKVSA